MSHKFHDLEVRRDRTVHVRYRKSPEDNIWESCFRLPQCLGDDASVEAALKTIIGEKGIVLIWNP